MPTTFTSDVTSRTVLITGAGRRIGRSLAEDLGAAGWSVAVHYNTSADDARAVADSITKSGGKAEIFGAELSDPAQVSSLISKVCDALGPVGCLINNASIFERDDVRSATLASWDAHMNINLRAPFLLSQGFAAQVPENASGAIINIVDERVWNLTPYFTSYTVSKAGLWTLTQTMAMALAPGIRVNAIGPGPTLPSVHQSQAEFDEQCASMPLKRGTTSEEICAAARFILSSPAMTGQMIALDGGQHLGWHRDASKGDMEG